MTLSHHRAWLLVWGLILCLSPGCDLGGRAGDNRQTGQADTEAAAAAALAEQRRAIAMEGTVGSVAHLQGDRFMRVRGYGLVWGLDGRGSKYCPPGIRDYLVREIRKVRLAHPHVERNLTAEQLIDSLNTSVVEVTGEIPAGAAKGWVLDVFVSASTVSPETRSLAGGYLLPCELKIFREVSPAEVIEGRTHGKARGPLFVNPFAASGESASGASPLEGRVIGQAVNLEDRRLSLNTTIASYLTVEKITNAINQRFTADPKTGDSTTPSHIELNVPPSERGREGRFIALVMHLPLSTSPFVREARAKTLVGELVRPGLPPEDAALSLEGIGPSVIPMIQELYTHSRRQVSYYAARTGLRLDDTPAVEVIIKHARDPRSPFRLQALRELGECRLRQRAATALRGLLADEDPRIRIRAYEALRQVHRESIVSVIVGRDPGNFVLDVVPAEGPPLIYARKTQIRRIALIGADHMALRPPLFYSKPGRQIAVSASEGDRFVTVLRKEAGKVLGESKVPLNVAQLTRYMGDDPRIRHDGTPQGLGLDYAVVLDVLYNLCEMGSVNAEMRWEEQSIEEIIGPLRPMGRPESEL